MTHITRRNILRTAGAVSAGALLAPSMLGAPLFVPERKTQRVVLIAMAGGVRTRETFGMPDNVPNLVAMAKEGVLYPKLRTSNLGHFGATMSIFTGLAEARGIRENARGPDPTIFEYLRKDLGLDKGDVWVTTSGGAQQVNYSYGLHPEYGPQYGANILDGDGIFNREFEELLERWGKPKAADPEEQKILERLRRGMGKGDAVKDAEQQARVEEYILNELTRGTSDIRGAAAGDRKALRLARNLMSIFKPKMLGVVLQNADIAHSSYNGYVEVVRQNDAAIGELMAAIREDEELATTTAVFVCPEFGRDADLNARRGLDHGDGSDDLRTVGCAAWGPDFKQGATVTADHKTIDLTTTICELMGAKAKLAKGGRLSGLYS
tara:strand:+ start:14560 stop:15696 length:1137 start_codon:yes stop_codon:yes gene_type:complete